MALLRAIREAQSALATIPSPEPQETVSGESLDRFLARLPSLWQQGEARPTHKPESTERSGEGAGTGHHRYGEETVPADMSGRGQ